MLFHANNRITLHQGGAEFQPALLHAIANATQSIALETYIFAPDEVGNALATALQQAARRGVRVQVTTDWHGTGRMHTQVLKRSFRAAGVAHRSFNPWYWHGLSRSHRKLCLIDERIAFVGGMNINDDWRCDFDPDLILTAPRWDFTAQIEGPLVGQIALDMQIQWARLGNITLLKRLQLALAVRKNKADGSTQPMLASYLVRDNWRNRRSIQRAYLQAIGSAHTSVYLATPYFAPGRKLKRALALAAERGVKVTLLLGAGQFALQDAVARAFYPRLLKSGVQLYEYRYSQLHGKVAVIDDQWATVGSSNCDGLSLFLNLEANVAVKDGEFAGQLRSKIERAIQDASAITAHEFVLIPWYKRAWYEMALLLYRSLLRVVTWGEYT